jgi:hypothetical protein
LTNVYPNNKKKNNNNNKKNNNNKVKSKPLELRSRVKITNARLFSLSSCFVYFMQRCHLVVKTASAGFSPIGGQPPKWPPSGHSESKTPQFIT